MHEMGTLIHIQIQGVFVVGVYYMIETAYKACVEEA